LITVLGVSMANSFSIQEFIAGNQREKNKAIEAAQAALNYAEWWLDQGNSSTGVTSGSCTQASAVQAVCSGALANPTVTAAVTCGSATSYAWTTGVMFNASLGNTMSIGNGASGDYCVFPMFYIQYIGTSSANAGHYMYQITAVGYGGNANAVAVLQSIYTF
ncbi:MAG: PilX N-terminal domain-containing pilus assembly protein, partial [Methylomonas sp.]